jgi:2-amino-4-hydroxy-6-hydroxymethyldihydropteridine diphosphokinase
VSSGSGFAAARALAHDPAPSAEATSRARGRAIVLGAGGRVKLPRMRIGYLGLGSNVGDRRAHLQAAADALPRHGVDVLASSSTYDTDPVGEVLEQPEFLNACLRVRTALDPEALLDACKAVERELGRAPRGPRHGPRPIDVDVLLLADVEHASARLRLPHEQVLARRFVLIPLLELDFELTAPSGERLADALAALPVTEGVRRAGPPLHVDRVAFRP